MIRRSWKLAAAALLALAGCKSTKLPVERPANAPRTIVVRDVRVLDVVAGAALEHQDVRIEDGKIVAIAATDAKVAADRVIEGAGKTLLPGLIDIHNHISSSPDPPWDSGLPDAPLNLARCLYSGVTTIFDPGAHDEDAFELRAKLASGQVLGPRLYVAGPAFTSPGGHPVPMIELALPPVLEGWAVSHMTRQVANEEEARGAVRALLPNKPDFVKIVIDRLPLPAPSMDRRVARAIADEARAGGVRVVAHIGTTTDAIDAAEAGVAAWIHGVYKERISDENIAKLKSYGIPMVPTLVVFDSYSTLGRAPRVPTELERELVEETRLASYDKRPDDFEVNRDMSELIDVLAAQREHALENVRRLYAAGVQIFAGSDAQASVFHGPGLHRELMLLAKAGLPPVDIIRAATIYPARFLTKSDDPPFGVIAPGKEADLVLVDGDPLTDLAAVSRIREVIVRGVPLVRRKIDAAR
jgi:imidazolonepropionase-like amidohydrolase